MSDSDGHDWVNGPAPPSSHGFTATRFTLRALRLPARPFLATVVCLLVGAATWMPLLHLFFAPGPQEFRTQDGLSPIGEQLAQRYLALWGNVTNEQTQFDRLRSSNPEWDLMGRTQEQVRERARPGRR